MTDTCVIVFYHARSRGNPCVPTMCVRFFFFPLHMYIFFSGSCADRVSQKSGPRIRSAIHDLHVSLVRTLPRGTEYMFFFLISLSACKGLCRRVSEMYLSDLATETGLGTSHLVELLGGQRVSRTVLQLGLRDFITDDVDGDDGGSDDTATRAAKLTTAATTTTTTAAAAAATMTKMTTTTSRNLARPRMGRERDHRQTSPAAPTLP